MCGHVRRGQLVVHHAGGDGAPRHAVVLSRIGTLGDDQSALVLDRADALRAVAAGAGEYDADGPFMLVLGERAKEEVDGQAVATRFGRFQ
ncbi:MAG: hypothetical protein AW07_02679 [Candidatus Accumulibacter sp. SK-11]|nr:MAG: hypothetical protein AW07_02679 [Candidatus Accumulibacter sp. SK-11]